MPPDVKIIGGGNGFPDVLAIASTDQETILGSGTLLDPLRSSSVLGSLLALYADPFVPIAVIGSPVSVTDDDPGAFVTAVALSAGGHQVIANPNSIGIIVDDPGDGSVRVQTAGEVTLTTAEWDVITQGSGGLTTGSVYYLAFGFNVFGRLTTTQSTTPGTFIAPIGNALSSTTLLLGVIPIVARST